MVIPSSHGYWTGLTHAEVFKEDSFAAPLGLIPGSASCEVSSFFSHTTIFVSDRKLLTCYQPVSNYERNALIE